MQRSRRSGRLWNQRILGRPADANRYPAQDEVNFETVMPSYTARDVRDLTKSQLHNMIDETKVCNLEAIRFNPKRDLFLRLAQSGLVFASWMEMIHDEWVRNLLENNPKLNPESIARTRRLMNEAVRYCLVTGYEGLKNQGKTGSGNTDPARSSAPLPSSPPPLAPASGRRGAKQLWGLATSEFFA